jgi:hypothetical protein
MFIKNQTLTLVLFVFLMWFNPRESLAGALGTGGIEHYGF